jgi:hypothetical protein
MSGPAVARGTRAAPTRPRSPDTQETNLLTATDTPYQPPGREREQCTHLAVRNESIYTPIKACDLMETAQAVAEHVLCLAELH